MPRNAKGNKSRADATRHKNLADATQRILTELKSDLEKNGKTSVSAPLDQVMTGKSSLAIMDQLLDKESDLCRAIPVDTLLKTHQGRRYLDILTVLQPSLRREAAEPGSSLPDGGGENQDNGMQIANRQQTEEALSQVDPLASLPELLPGGESGQLGDLVREVLSSGDICRMNGETPQATDLAAMFQNVSGLIAKKTADGTLDLAALDQQAQGMLGKITQEHPELQSMLASPDIAALMGGLAGELGAGGPSFGR